MIAATDAQLGGGAICIDNATLRVTGAGFATARGWVFDHNGATLEIPEGTLALNGEIYGPGALNKTGAGTLQINAANNWWGPLNIEEGAVVLGDDKALNPNPAAPLAINAGALDLGGCDVQVGNFYLNDGALTGAGSLAAYSFNLRKGEVSAVLADFMNGQDTHPVNLYKTGSGTVTLSAANTYTGNTFVEDGTLNIEGSVAGAAHVTGGTLSGGGAIARTLLVLAGGRVSPSATLTLGRHLMIQDGAFLARADGRLLLANPEGRVILDNACLDVVPSSDYAPFTIIEGGKVEGIFNGLPEGASFTRNNRRYRISYADNVVLTPIPTGTLVIVR